ncbi:unnamed protein product [Soboliphyme baturini]|uniref:Peptidase_M1_N domain-containing protein n=1 Tax=Soboliphyme baturini TaxID=241478 RepID=A0A183IN89_9BILA|nr:unnamed protein product [Soboliphyme baturini]
MEENGEQKGYIRLSYLAAGAILLVFVFCLLAVGLGVHYGEMSNAIVATTSATEKTTTTSAPIATTTETPLNPSDWRLPDTIVPSEYDLQVRPYLPSSSVTYEPSKNFTFDANVTIKMICKKEAETIVMNLKNLIIDYIKLEKANGSPIKLQQNPYSIDKTLERVTVFPEQKLLTNHSYIMTITYRGILSDSLGGFYRSKYEENGKTNFINEFCLRWLAVTHFECCNARAALPCFDSPEFKASFRVTIIHPKDMVALSNEDLESRSLKCFFREPGGWNRVVFHPTPRMSSYLLAFTVNAFEKRTSFTESDPQVMFRVWSPPGAQNETLFATMSGPTVLDYYGKYFNEQFPLPKQGQILKTLFNP